MDKFSAACLGVDGSTVCGQYPWGSWFQSEPADELSDGFSV